MTISSLPFISSPTVDSVSISTAVMAKSLDTAETAGREMIRMLEQSVNPGLGTNLDLMV